MERKDEILKLFEKVESKDLIIRSVDEMLFLESQLEELRKVPHIKYHPEHPEIQKRTEAGKLYKEYLQQYNNLVKTLCSVLNKNDIDNEDSPLRAYFQKVKNL
jgi:hypothetical protein